jgi:threonine dehydratase
VVDEVMLVTTDETCAAIQDIYEDTRAIVEPAGALAVAAIKQYVAREGIKGETLIALNCGANMNFDRLRHVTERADLGAHREALFAVEIPEQPGSFLRFCQVIGDRNVTEFNYRYSHGDMACIFVGIAVPDGPEGKVRLQAKIEAAGFPVTDMSDNELAKLHVRYMVGGHAAELKDERLFRFEFPERPGALLRFLQAVGSDWNISLFHYRNHGSSNGRVLAGIQVPPASAASFDAHMQELGYQYTEESGNPAVRLFLA